MAPIRRSEDYGDDNSGDGFVDDLPWDPLLDYVMGHEEIQEKKSWSRGPRGKRQQQESDTDSFLDFLFPVDEAPRAQTSSRSKTTKTAASNKDGSAKSATKSKGSRMGFWRRKKRPQQQESEDMWDVGSIASTFDFSKEEDRGTQKQKDRSKRWGQGQGPAQAQSRGSPSPRLSSGKQTTPRSSHISSEGASKKRSMQSGSSLFGELAQSLSPWGDGGYSSSEGSRSEDFTQDEASSYESTEGPSLPLTDEDDNSTIASRSEASSLLRDNGERDTSIVYNEVRLKFQSGDKSETSALPPMPPMEEDEDESRALPNGFGDRRALSNGFDERRDEAAENEPQPDAVQEIDDGSGEGQFDIGPYWDVAPIVPSASASTADEQSLARSEKKIERKSSWSLDRNSPVPRGITNLPRGLAKKLVCCGATEQELYWSEQYGVPIQELSADELATIFPKLRLVSDQKESQFRSEVVGNSHSFEKNLPAHLQLPPKTLVLDSGPLSLFEYEFESGKHMNVTFAGFGLLPRTLLKVEAHKEPPRSYEVGLVSFNKILVQVEASTVSQTDCFIRRGEWWGRSQVSLPNTPGVDIVGKLYRIDKESAQRTSLKKGDRVLSLTKWGGNSRYLSVDPERLVKVPESVDPAEAACLVETYLTAFQLLHFSQSPGARYRKTSLKAKTFLILGAITPNMGRALAQLSTVAGADVIYATSKPKHFQQLTSLGFVPLSQDPVDWFDKLKGSVDLIISLGEAVTPLAYKLIKASGEIVIATNSEVDLAPDVELIRQPSKLMCTRGESQRRSRTHSYDVYFEWDKDLGRCKKDLAHLVKLLEIRAITPHVLDRIPLGKVARAQEIIESKRLSGFLVCEPWLLSKARAIRL